MHNSDIRHQIYMRVVARCVAALKQAPHFRFAFIATHHAAFRHMGDGRVKGDGGSARALIGKKTLSARRRKTQRCRARCSMLRVVL